MKHIVDVAQHNDAPGWNDDVEKQSNISTRSQHAEEQTLGPLCWKCSGKKFVTAKYDQKINCKICHGLGRLKRKKKEIKANSKPGKIAKRQRRIPPVGYVIPGPVPRGYVNLEDGEELCSLVGHWKIYQRIGGHRWSTDDLVTAYIAGKYARKYGISIQRHLDLGCGIGSVLLMIAWQFQEARCTGIEAQSLSASMAKRSLDFNLGEETDERERAEVFQGDIRNFSLIDEKFDLITGTPPYFKIRRSDSGEVTTDFGGLPSCKQSAPARFEFRGGIEEYCQSGAHWLKDQGLFVICEGLSQKRNQQRVKQSARESNLEILQQIEVHGRSDKPPLFGVYVMCKKAATVYFASSPIINKLIVRYKGGERSTQYKQLMLEMGIIP